MGIHLGYRSHSNSHRWPPAQCSECQSDEIQTSAGTFEPSSLGIALQAWQKRFICGEQFFQSRNCSPISPQHKSSFHLFSEKLIPVAKAQGWWCSKLCLRSSTGPVPSTPKAGEQMEEILKYPNFINAHLKSILVLYLIIDDFFGHLTSTVFGGPELVVACFGSPELIDLFFHG